MSILDALITDRVPGATYGWQDMNRVAEAMEYIAARLRSYGWEIEVSPQRFTREDFPTESALEHYIAQLRELRSAITLLITTPPVPGVSRDRPYMTVQEANDIERILQILEQVISAMSAVFLRSAQPLLYCGWGLYLPTAPPTEKHVYTSDGLPVYTSDGLAVLVI